MKSKLLDILRKCIDWFQRLYLWLAHSEDDATLPYHSLSPINDADKDRSYYNALNWALKNRKREDIKNIAITGPFGSGKSSVIKTFQEVNTDKNLHFLNISLATFKDEKSNEAANQDLLRLIELSILQQILYHEEDKKIPDSRFGKIKSFTKQRMLYTTLALLTFIFLSFNLFWHTILFKEIIRVEIPSKWELFLYYTSLATFTVGIGFIVFKSIRLLHGIRISKFTIQSAEIELSPNVSKSILNNHIDEILYFFEVTKYNVVIIEDLDRFEQTEIFTKLREINLLINSSKKIKNEVAFIYAVRDDMFVDKDRTKFFDFIIPIIPVINSSNSNEILLEKKKINNYDISEDLIENISLFIDDMRLLHNIINEYHIYHLKLNKSLSQDKLLSMIVYKNIYPDDFSKLSCNKGDLFATINNKNTYTRNEVLRIDNTIMKLKNQIKELESLKITELNELKSLYIIRYITNLQNFDSFVIANDKRNYQDLLKDEIFEQFTIDNVQYNKYEAYNISKTRVTLKFEQVEKDVNPKKTYKERKEQIIQFNNNLHETLKREIEELERETIKIKHSRIKELIGDDNLKFVSENQRQKELIRVLLLNGYIDEDYLDYISIFYEGSITKHDQEFLLCIKSQQYSDYDFNLYKIDNLIKKINLNEFSKTHILNYKLVDYIIGTNQYNEQKTLVFKLLANGTERSINFIDGFIKNGLNVGLFVKDLCKSWIEIWDYINNLSTYTKEKKQVYFSLILENADLDDIKSISERSNFIQTASTTSNFLNITSDEDKLKAVVKEFSIKFSSLTIDDSSKEMIDFVYEGCFYELNNEMIELFIRYKGNFNQSTFDTQNYYSIKHSKCANLLAYVNDNINTYISNVYLKIDSNINEDDACFLELLNNESLSLDNKTNIIHKVATKIKNLSESTNLDIDNILLKASKVVPTWDNLVNNYQNNESKLSESSIIFLNQNDNVKILSESLIPSDKEDETTYNDFIFTILETAEINDTSFALLLRSVPFICESLDFKALSYGKVESLISNKMLVLNLDNFNLMKESFGPLHIKFIETQIDVLFDVLHDLKFDQNDILQILRSTVLTSAQKNMIISNIDITLINVNTESIMHIGELIIFDHSFDVQNDTLNLVLANSLLDIFQKIEIFNIKCNSISREDISNFLTSLGEPYSQIAISGKRPAIINTDLNKLFVKALKSVSYISNYDLEKKTIRVSTFRNK